MLKILISPPSSQTAALVSIAVMVLAWLRMAFAITCQYPILVRIYQIRLTGTVGSQRKLIGVQRLVCPWFDLPVFVLGRAMFRPKLTHPGLSIQAPFLVPDPQPMCDRSGRATLRIEYEPKFREFSS